MLSLCYSGQQICTEPVYNGSDNSIVKGLCHSSEVLAAVGKIVKFECSFETGNNIFWTVTGLPPVINLKDLKTVP